MIDEINKGEIVNEVTNAFKAYEEALINNDINKMNSFFWNVSQTIRYGIADIQYGAQAIFTWRSTASPVPTERELYHTIVTTFGNDFATVSTEFTNNDQSKLSGRQMQTWARVGSTLDDYQGWKIVAAHVSVIPSIEK